MIQFDMSFHHTFSIKYGIGFSIFASKIVSDKIFRLIRLVLDNFLFPIILGNCNIWIC